MVALVINGKALPTADLTFLILMGLILPITNLQVLVQQLFSEEMLLYHLIQPHVHLLEMI